MGIAHQSSDPLLINLYVSKDARHWSSIHDGMTIKRLSQVSHGCPADVHVSNMCHSFKRSFSNYVTCYKRMIYTYIYIYMYMFWITFENNSWRLISFLLYVFLCNVISKRNRNAPWILHQGRTPNESQGEPLQRFHVGMCASDRSDSWAKVMSCLPWLAGCCFWFKIMLDN